jgi:hypothetical protein
MRDYYDPLTSVPSRKFLHARDHSEGSLSGTFPTRDGIVRSSALEESIFFGELLPNFPLQQSLKYSEVPFAQR